MLKVFTILMCCLFINKATGQTIELDYSFGDSGLVSIEGNTVTGLFLQPDNKILLTFFSGFKVRKLNEDGSVDSIFGIDGTSEVILGQSRCAVIQEDGKIVQAGDNDTSQTILIRHLPNGVLDSSFGNSGIAHLALIDNYDPAITIQQDQKILLCSYAYSKLAVARVNQNGALDSSFNGTGYLYVDLPFSYDFGSGIQVLPNGKIIATGYSFVGSTDEVQAVRILSNGIVDSTFGVNGIFSINTGPYDYAMDMTIQQDGKILIAGYAKKDVPPFDYDFTVVRADINGKSDSTFGNNGLVKVALGTGSDNVDWCFGVEVQPDGKIILAGKYFKNGVNTAALVRLLPDGTLDTSFDNDGILKAAFGPSYYMTAVQPDGKIIAAGTQLARYLNNLITGPCTSNFSLYPDTFELHKYWAVNLASGTPPMTYIWSWGDGTYDTLPYPSHTYDAAGFYTICLNVFDSLGCVNNFCNSFDLLKLMSSNKLNEMLTVNVISNIPVQANAQSSESNSITIYPNPAQTKINIHLSRPPVESIRIRMINYLGTVVYDQALEPRNHSRITITPSESIPSGYYLVKVQIGSQILATPVFFLR